MPRRVALLAPFPMIRSPVEVMGESALNAAVAVVCPVPPLAIGSVPTTPLVSGRPVALVSVTLEGVPRAGVTSVGLVERTTLPLPVVARLPRTLPLL